jgi:hypothetical protein
MLMISRKSNRGSMAVAVFVLGAAFALAGCTGQPLSTREKGTLGGGVRAGVCGRAGVWF